MQLLTSESEFEARLYASQIFIFLHCAMLVNMLSGGKCNLGHCLVTQLTGPAEPITVFQLKRKD